MTRIELSKRYFEWMYRLVCGDKRKLRTSFNISYRELLNHLHSISFRYSIDMDKNRAEDGTDLRYRFGQENGYSKTDIFQYLDTRPCSCLEMLVALSVRCEEHIMEDSNIGDRTGQWFWNMIVNLGLGSQTDVNYNPDYVDFRLNRWLDHRYESNGEGGLFTVQNPRRDMRDTEIWYQLCWYLEEMES